MTDNTYVCLEQLANKIHTVLEVDLGVKVAVAIVPTKMGATRRMQAVHTARGWMQAATRGSAMYGASDCAGASRRPLDAVMILDYQPVAGGYAPSGVVACQRAERIPRGTYRNDTTTMMMTTNELLLLLHNVIYNNQIGGGGQR
jgi:hypothetical protein